MKRDGFIKDFYRATKFPVSQRFFFIDHVPVFLMWPVTWALSFLPFIRPEHVVILGFICRVAAPVMVWLGAEYYPLATALWLTGMLLDYVDGQLARYTGRVSQAGGLLDLASDYVTHALLVLAFVGLTGNTLWMFLPIFAVQILSIELYSYCLWRFTQTSTNHQKLASEFLHKPEITSPEGWCEVSLQRLYHFTWVPFLRVAYSLPFWNRVSFNQVTGAIAAFAGSGVYFFIGALFMCLGINPMFYFVYVVGVFIALLGVLALNKVRQLIA